MENFAPYAVVLAGGRGSRLPIAGSIPKQFAPKFYDDKEKTSITFVQDIVKMITKKAIKPSKIIVVVTSEEQRQFAIEQLTPYKVPSTNVVIFDPHYGYVAVMAAAADYIYRHDKNAVIFYTPSDSHIKGQELLTEAIVQACNEAHTGRPVLIGAKVADANIVGGCGNAKYDASQPGPFYEIENFIEKPGRLGEDYVKRILMDDNTVVNTGLYAIKASQFCRMYPQKKIDALLKKYYDDGDIRADLGLDPTEMVSKLGMRLMIGGFEWMDCGTLDAYYKIQVKTPNHRNASIGEVKRFKCLGGLFVSATEGMPIIASKIQGGVAVLAHMHDGKPRIVVSSMQMSQEVGRIMEFFEKGNYAVPYSLNSENCTLVPSNLSDETLIAFLGVKNISVTVNSIEIDDGKVIVPVQVSNPTGDCIFREKK